jgi:NADH-quinone oxidoreductase subunit J
MSPFYRVQFYLFALMAIAAAILFVTRKSPISAALWLVNVMFALAGLYVMLDAPFVAAVQVLVYAGAIMVVFVFVVMLLNIGRGGQLPDLRALAPRVGAGVVAMIFCATLLATMRESLPEITLAPHEDNVVAPVAASLFTDYLLAFELTSVVLLVAVIGAVVLAKRKAGT